MERPDSRAAVCLTAGQTSGRPIREPDSRSVSVSASDQCISSVAAVVLFKKYLKNIQHDSSFAYRMFSTFFKLSRTSVTLLLCGVQRFSFTAGPADGRHRKHSVVDFFQIKLSK